MPNAMQNQLSDQYLRSVEKKPETPGPAAGYPFCLPVVQHMKRLDFHPKATFIIGENGTGKSTLLEAIAINFGFNPEGGTRNFHFSSRETHSSLHQHIRLAKGLRRPRDGFFLRAESFYNVASNIDDLGVTDAYGGASLHQMSHGESFWAVLMHRLEGHGLYLLDEPEAALSPARQMAFLTRMHDLIGRHSQFVLATHSPIIMAYPEAVIYEIGTCIRRVEYTATEHYRIMRRFMHNPERMLEKLLADDEPVV